MPTLVDITPLQPVRAQFRHMLSCCSLRELTSNRCKAVAAYEGSTPTHIVYQFQQLLHGVRHRIGRLALRPLLLLSGKLISCSRIRNGGKSHNLALYFIVFKAHQACCENTNFYPTAYQPTNLCSQSTLTAPRPRRCTIGFEIPLHNRCHLILSWFVAADTVGSFSPFCGDARA